MFEAVGEGYVGRWGIDAWGGGGGMRGAVGEECVGWWARDAWGGGRGMRGAVGEGFVGRWARDAWGGGRGNCEGRNKAKSLLPDISLSSHIYYPTEYFHTTVQPVCAHVVGERFRGKYPSVG